MSNWLLRHIKWFFTATITEEQKIKCLPYIIIATFLAVYLGNYLGEHHIGIFK